MNRRSFLTTLAAAAALPAQDRRRPNFVVILADDLGYGDLACYGSKQNQTPHLDRMAAEGIRFDGLLRADAVLCSLKGGAAHRSLSFQKSCHNPAPDSGINDIGLPPGEITIAELLKPLGYATICIGKWHLGHKPEFLPRKQGFDEYYGILYSNDMRPVQIVHNEQVAKYPVIQSEITKDYTEHAVRFIQQNKDRPFFLYLPHAMPHKPLAALRTSIPRTNPAICTRTLSANSTGQSDVFWRACARISWMTIRWSSFFPTTDRGSGAALAA